MAKGAASERMLGGVHSQLARVFSRVLEKYERGLEALDNIPRDQVEGDLIEALMDLSEPNPAMLSAIAKFLKDNDIGIDSDEVEKLNATERRLADKRKARKEAGVNLSLVPHVESA